MPVFDEATENVVFDNAVLNGHRRDTVILLASPLRRDWNAG